MLLVGIDAFVIVVVNEYNVVVGFFSVDAIVVMHYKLWMYFCCRLLCCRRYCCFR